MHHLTPEDFATDQQIARNHARLLNRNRSTSNNMKLSNPGSNQTEIERADGVTIFYSYGTAVAAFVPGRGCLCTSQKYSNTTTRHVSQFVDRCGATRHDVTQAEINKIAA